MIEYKMIKEFKEKDLEELFLSVNWSSGKYPDKLKVAMLNSDTVITAWDGEKLIGLMNALSDKIMTAYFHYLLVNPDYHEKGIGKTLVEKMLIAYEEEMGFYEKLGFEYHPDKKAMMITYLTT